LTGQVATPSENGQSITPSFMTKTILPVFGALKATGVGLNTKFIMIKKPVGESKEKVPGLQ
jgi:hypothetical protein